MPTAVVKFSHDINDRAKLASRVRIALEELVEDEFLGSDLQFKEGKNIVYFNFSIGGFKLSGEILLAEKDVEARLKLPLIGIAMKSIVIEKLEELVPKYLKD
tara:strand:- start:24086 stop:24391 length:306 start_codon:yes stop_codon:yes gene_type:complete